MGQKLAQGSKAFIFVLFTFSFSFILQLEHKKSYESETEENFRLKIFMDNKHKIAKHNQLYEQGSISYNLKLNKYADLLHHEFVRQLNGFNKTAQLK